MPADAKNQHERIGAVETNLETLEARADRTDRKIDDLGTEMREGFRRILDQRLTDAKPNLSAIAAVTGVLITLGLVYSNQFKDTMVDHKRSIEKLEEWGVDGIKTDAESRKDRAKIAADLDRLREETRQEFVALDTRLQREFTPAVRGVEELNPRVTRNETEIQHLKRAVFGVQLAP